MRYCPQCRHTYRNAQDRCPKDNARLLEDNQPDPFIGSVLAGRYQILSFLGGGGMGRVYEAEHIEIGKKFAVKVLFGDHLHNEKTIARFRREARATSRLDHHHIVNVTDFGLSEQDDPFLVMQLLRGKPLSQIIMEEGPLPPGRAAHIARQVGLALAHAHDNGVLHRDLKPDNIFIENREEAVDFTTVLDFGLAQILQPEHESDKRKITAIGMTHGTPEYMSPEQAMGEELGPASDLYTLGVVFYCMLSQRLPFDLPTNRMDILQMHAYEPPIPLRKVIDVPEELESIVMRLLRKIPNQRYASGRELAFAIDVLRKKHTTLAPRDIPESATQLTLTSQPRLSETSLAEDAATELRSVTSKTDENSVEMVGQDTLVSFSPVKLPQTETPLERPKGYQIMLPSEAKVRDKETLQLIPAMRVSGDIEDAMTEQVVPPPARLAPVPEELLASSIERELAAEEIAAIQKPKIRWPWFVAAAVLLAVSLWGFLQLR